MSVLNILVARRTHLSDSSRKVADWIIAHPAQAVLLTSQALAAQAEVSQSSIVKFTQKLGFRGYSDFKLALTEDLARKQALQTTPLHSNILLDDPLAVIAQKLVQAKTDAMFQTTNALSLEACYEAVSWIDQASRVQVLGIGGSALTAKDLSYKLLKLGITALSEQDSHVQIATARTLTEQDVQIVISFSGDRKEMLVAADAAKQKGARVIALTSTRKNKLRAMADLVFDTVADESQHRSSSIASRTAQNVITDLLFITLVQQRDESARKLIDDISSDIRLILK
ncbi:MULTISPECIES: SIS domain-containing protein [Vibrio]|uniref:MurPQ operon transcriptional repressor MurR n=1 Tax=Vibrio proteolyticus NBRC 13287 TaxID=1219065 RepID=U3A4Z4_VIBPR|nr:SIS domain-containing protein [Vibrio proteolyticus]NAW56232.1 SIS domain-containing protein [Vibrio sp. V36_P2S2PM302]NAX25506.1 SIS domain-containing protein [Vibrio sp. V38_P2S17PM301]NAX31407.1 SIS domain-containing protein [Vibrio sp. V37_P2S8PM304]GAD68770.1 murPQ operon transcriptional repressor MurR [Vibrio proteolyticus NBRC 13287]